MPTLYVAFVALVLIKYLLLVGNNPVVAALSAVAMGGVCGLSTLLMGYALSFSAFNKIRPIIFLGVAAAGLILPIFISQSTFDLRAFQQVLFIIAAIVFIFYFFIEKKARVAYLPVAQATRGSSSECTRWQDIFFSQPKTIQITLVMTIPFFFCNGFFRAISLEMGYAFALSNIVLYCVSSVLVVLFVINLLARSASWFNVFLLCVEGAMIVALFSLLIIPDFPFAIIGIIRAGLVFLQVWVLVLLQETSHKQKISPVFLYSVLAIVNFFSQIIGDVAASFLLIQFEEVVPILVGGSLMVIAIFVGAIVVLLINNKNFDTTKKASSASAGDENISTSSPTTKLVFEDFCTNHGISERESEVISLYSQGRSVRHISTRLYVSESTVRTYIQRVYSKLGIHNRQELLDILDKKNEDDKSVAP